MKPSAQVHAHHREPHTHTHQPTNTTLTQGVARRLLVAAPALLLLWLLVAWALQ
ncbi:MAG: hypothetical protein JNK52_10045 [Zoogloeaceae bacterium]|nr:hypothetical protein [Zoogloeaceae bacterium]